MSRKPLFFSKSPSFLGLEVLPHTDFAVDCVLTVKLTGGPPVGATVAPTWLFSIRRRLFPCLWLRVRSLAPVRVVRAAVRLYEGHLAYLCRRQSKKRIEMRGPRAPTAINCRVFQPTDGARGRQQRMRGPGTGRPPAGRRRQGRRKRRRPSRSWTRPSSSHARPARAP